MLSHSVIRVRVWFTIVNPKRMQIKYYYFIFLSAKRSVTVDLWTVLRAPFMRNCWISAVKARNLLCTHTSGRADSGFSLILNMLIGMTMWAGIASVFISIHFFHFFVDNCGMAETVQPCSRCHLTLSPHIFIFVIVFILDSRDKNSVTKKMISHVIGMPNLWHIFYILFLLPRNKKSVQCVLAAKKCCDDTRNSHINFGSRFRN